MSDENPTTEAPPEASITLSADQEAVLREHGIEVPADGKIAVTDHLKLLNTLGTLKSRVRTIESEKEQERLAAMSEADRKIEEARLAGRTEAESAYKVEVTKAKVTAAAAAAQFNDPADAHSMIPDLSALEAEEDIKAAVAKLAEQKPYLVKQAPKPTPPAGPQSKVRDGEAKTATDWLRSTLEAR